MNFEKLTDSFWKLQIIGWFIYFVLMFVTYLSVDTPDSMIRILFTKLFRSLFGLVLTCILWQFYQRVIDLRFLGKNITIISVSSIVFGVIWTILEVVYFVVTEPKFDPLGNLQYKPRVALGYTLTIMAWSAIYLGVKYWQQLNEERKNAIEAKLLAERAQLEMLRYQVNPHFLFNSLNSVKALINDDNKPARNMINQLAEFLRHSLLSENTREVPLSEELEAVENYLAIEKIRFEESLEIEYRIDEKAKTVKVPGFLLNPLVENAIKHGFPVSPELLRIKISAKYENDRLLIEVANSGKLNENPAVSGTKIGLKNIRERLAKLFPGESSFMLFEENGFVIARIEISKR